MNRMMECVVEAESVIRAKENRDKERERERERERDEDHIQTYASSSGPTETSPLLKQRSSRENKLVEDVVVKFPDFRDNRHQSRSSDTSSDCGYNQPEWIEELRCLMRNDPPSPQVFTVEFTLDCMIYRGSWGCLMLEAEFIIDVLAIFPFYLEILISLLSGTSVVSGATAVEGFAALRVLRLLRVVRIFKVFERSAKLRVLSLALSKSVDGIVLLLLVSPLLVCFFATLSFYAEQTDEYYKDGVWYYNNGDRSPFQSISQCFWLTIVTLTTVGYGDVTPRTSLGRFVSAFASLAALVFLAFPLTIITTQYTNVLNDEVEREKEEAYQKEREQKARQITIPQHANLLREISYEKLGNRSPALLSPAVVNGGSSSATSSLSSSPTRGSYFSYKVPEAKAPAARLVDMARVDDVITLRLSVNGEEGFKKVMQLLSEATSSGSPSP
ncbi:Potassium voltage-gated channel sub D member 1 [Dinochytrium kinnereticum]|nr:Potassium voltage-gated channel sub D member 1 [Dinochytrium kinnereticum]